MHKLRSTKVKNTNWQVVVEAEPTSEGSGEGVGEGVGEDVGEGVGEGVGVGVGVGDAVVRPVDPKNFVNFCTRLVSLLLPLFALSITHLFFFLSLSLLSLSNLFYSQLYLKLLRLLLLNL
jgi:hypothetical protein